MNIPIIAPQPPDPVQAVETCQQYLARCRQQLSNARTVVERREAQLWVDNAERQLMRWMSALERAR